MIFIDHGNFHVEDNDLKCTSTLELVHLPKSIESHNMSEDFIEPFKNKEIAV